MCLSLLFHTILEGSHSIVTSAHLLQIQQFSNDFSNVFEVILVACLPDFVVKIYANGFICPKASIFP